MIICDVHVLLADTVNDTLQQMDDDDFNVDMFLIYEEMTSFNGKSPPQARNDLSEFIHSRRQPFIKCFHLIAVNPIAQIYLAKDLHNTVHGGLLRPGVEPFLRAIHNLGFHHSYYSSKSLTHANNFIKILNGSAAKRLSSFKKIDFKMMLSRINTSVVGQRWNSQYTWGVASLDFKRNNPNDMVTHPSIKSANVSDGMLQQFIVLSDLLLEVDKDNDFYCGLTAGNDRRIRHAQRLMNEDPLIPKRDKERNVIESVSGICNIYSKASKSDMFTGAHEVQVALDHSAISPQLLTEPGEINSKDRMKAKFTAWGIDMKWVCLFPHVDDFNGRL